MTVVVWRDDGYGLIDWKQRNEFGRPFGVEFGNPDFVALRRRRSGSRPGGRRHRGDLARCLAEALAVDGPALVEVPIDYRENLRLTDRLGALADEVARGRSERSRVSVGQTAGFFGFFGFGGRFGVLSPIPSPHIDQGASRKEGSLNDSPRSTIQVRCDREIAVTRVARPRGRSAPPAPRFGRICCAEGQRETSDPKRCERPSLGRDIVGDPRIIDASPGGAPNWTRTRAANDWHGRRVLGRGLDDREPLGIFRRARRARIVAVPECPVRRRAGSARPPTTMGGPFCRGVARRRNPRWCGSDPGTARSSPTAGGAATGSSRPGTRHEP